MGEESINNAENEKSSSAKSSGLLVTVLIAVLAVLLIFNQYQISKIAKGGAAITGAAVTSTSNGGSVQETSAGTIEGVIPTGVPNIYGKELGISFDDVSPSDPQKADAAIDKLSKFDTSITLEGDKLQRYIKIGSSISCEYCCGAKGLIFSNGQAACGCAHSYSMRGLAKYLLQNHANEYTDEQILEELGKWKVLFFPDIHMQKAQVLQQKGIELNYVNLASNKYRGIEKGATSTGGSMVGGC